jgi:hypothetical protein
MRPIDVAEHVILCVNFIIKMLILCREVPPDCTKRHASTFLCQKQLFLLIQQMVLLVTTVIKG